jgi:transposase InsO family protein
MPWKETVVMEERFRLIERRDAGESIAELARRFEVSRKTVYKWLERYQAGGMEKLADRSRRPLVQAGRTDEAIEKWLVDLRHTHNSWGPRKLRQFLVRRQPEKRWPAESTIALILDRHGLTAKRKKRHRATPSAQPLQAAKEANDIWSIDFKGWFLCGNGERCDPLTVSDAATRYLLCCESMENTDTDSVKKTLTGLFQQFGLPRRIRSDNGPPFASTGLGGLSRLSVWWIRLGILPERIEPGEPQQNGRHERMHRTLHQETANPASANVKKQQKSFDQFRTTYNCERPHEALKGACPNDLYKASTRTFPVTLPELEYREGLELRKADQDGKIRWKQARCRLGQALANEVVGVEPIDDGVQRIWIGPVLLGLLDERKGFSQTANKRDSSWPPLQSPFGSLRGGQLLKKKSGTKPTECNPCA